MSKRMTRLQERKQRDRSRRDTRVRFIKKYPLCVSHNFVEYAYHMKWDDETADAAALVMHKCFMILRRQPNDNGWVPMSYKMFKGIFGAGYKRIRDHLINIGFLEYDAKRKYKKRSHCSHYRICEELRYDKISASYHLKSKELQEQFIKEKKYWKSMTKVKRQEVVRTKIDTAFTPSANSSNRSKSFYELVEQGHLTIEQFTTIKELLLYLHSLKLNIDEASITEIARKRYYNSTKKRNCDFSAYEQYFIDMVDRVLGVSISIKSNGRFYGAMTGMAREFWDYAFLGKEQLAEVDIKSSHVYCLLALLKDISIYYFGSNGTHEERLSKCRFVRQITMIPGLVEHLRVTCPLYEMKQYFEFREDIPSNSIEYRRFMFSIYSDFTRGYFKTLRKKNNSIHNNPYFSEKCTNFINNTHVIHATNASYSTNVTAISDETTDITDKFQDIQDNSIPNTYNTCTNNTLLSLYSSLHYNHNSHLNKQFSPLHADLMAVGVRQQPSYSKRVMKNFHACGFSLKPEIEQNKSIANFPDIPIFRNLFFPCQEEISVFEELLNKDIYRLLMKEIGITMKRGEFKKEFFHFLYRPALSRYIRTWHWEDGGWNSEGNEEPVRKAMEALLPSITFFLDLCKCCPGTLDRRGDNYKWISRAMLSIGITSTKSVFRIGGNRPIMQ